MKYGVLIPAYEPDRHLLDLVDELRERGLAVIVVDDGSKEGSDIFCKLEKDGYAAVLHHDHNCGKGRALKTGIAYMKEHGFEGVVTADADGQHAAADIERIGKALPEQPGCLILGRRNVKSMPAKSRTGNTMTRFLFRVLYGISLEDTQTGLRGIPLTEDLADRLLRLDGERYEYEMEMLIHSKRLFPGGLAEIPIQTLYLDGNTSSHFRPLKDGAKIYRLLFRSMPLFMAVSLLSFGIDYGLFNLFYYALLKQTVLSTVCARIISGTANFLMNKYLVFGNKNSKYTLWNYLKLAVIILLLNSCLMFLLVDLLRLPAFTTKIIVEILLYFVSFSVQNKLASQPDKEKP